MKFTLTDEQIKTIEPLFKLVREWELKDKRGAIFAQILRTYSDDVIADCRFLTHEVAKEVQQAIRTGPLSERNHPMV